MSSLIAEQGTLEKLFCWSCGKNLHPKSKFCSACGENLTAALVGEEIATSSVDAHVAATLEPSRELIEKSPTQTVGARKRRVPSMFTETINEVVTDLPPVPQYASLPETIEQPKLPIEELIAPLAVGRKRSLPGLLAKTIQDQDIEVLTSPPVAEFSEEELRPHPWLRYWARMTDFTIYMCFAGVIIACILGFATALGAFQDPVGKIFWVPMADRLLTLPFLFAWLFIEAYFISHFSATLGKWLFGIKVLRVDGSKLTYKQALSRAFRVWCFGLGCGIPYWTHMAQIVSFCSLKVKGKSDWDNDICTQSVSRPIGTMRKILTMAILVPIILFFAGYLLVVNSPGYKPYE